MRGLSVVKEKEHTYFDKFDFITTKEEFIEELNQQLQDEAPGNKEGQD
jgi:hypothetical protein